MNFGEPSPCSVDTANGFMVERVKKTPPGEIGLSSSLSNMAWLAIILGFEKIAPALMGGSCRMSPTTLQIFDCT